MTANKLLGLCNIAVGKGFTEINLLLSSHGGHIMSGFAVYNQLMALPVAVNTYNIGSVDSIANIIFLAGERRQATPNATFLFHGSKWGWPSAVELQRSQLAEIVNVLAAEEDRIIKVFLERTGLTAEELREFFTQGVTKDARFALEKGVVHEVNPVSIPSGVEVIQIG
jgi:ATP-dependent protease ClpP protease subunit